MNGETRGLLKRLWAGDVGLAKTYWIYGYVLAFVVSFGTTMVLFGSGVSLVWAAVWVPAHTLPYTVVWAVACWRSASKYQGPRIWVWVGKATIILQPVIVTTVVSWLALLVVFRVAAVRTVGIGPHRYGQARRRTLGVDVLSSCREVD